MASIGERLRAAREKTGRDLAGIAKETKINLQYLEALEADELSRLPGPFFARAFVRQLAQILDLPPKELDAAVQGQMATETPVFAAGEEAMKVPEGIGLPPVTHVQEGGRGQRRRLGGALMLLLAVTAACAVVYAFWLRWEASNKLAEVTGLSREAAAVLETPPADEPTAAAEPEQLNAPPPVPADAPQPATAPTPAEAGQTPPQILGQGSVSFVLAASEDVWVRVNSGGQALWTGILGPGETREFSDLPEAVVRTGNAGGLSVVLNGEPIPNIGPRGQIRIITLTEEGATVSSPARPPTVTVEAEDLQGDDRGN